MSGGVRHDPSGEAQRASLGGSPPGTQHPRRRRQLDWELIACGVKGHVLAGRGARLAGEREALVTRDDGEVRWHRCLRCDVWVALPRPAQGPAGPAGPAGAAGPVGLADSRNGSEIVVPLRGQALRDRIVLRLIAVDRVVHFLVLGVLGVGVLAFAANRTSLRDTFYRVLTALQGGVAGGPVQTSGHVGILRDLDKLFTLRSGTLTEVGVALLVYAMLEGIEAIGLWAAKRWAEYLTFVSTTLLLPLEVHEIIHKASALKVIGFLINVAVVGYLLFKKRLFGLRGGSAADQAEREQDMGWEAIERATVATPGGPAQGSSP